MVRLNGGELLLDLRFIGNLIVNHTIDLPDDIKKQILEIGTFKDGGFRNLKKPIHAKCLVDDYQIEVIFTSISDDLASIYGTFIMGEYSYVFTLSDLGISYTETELAHA